MFNWNDVLFVPVVVKFGGDTIIVGNVKNVLVVFIVVEIS